MEIIKWCLKYLNIKTKIIFSSDLKLEKKKSERLIEICKKLNVDLYLSTIGAKDYLDKDKKLFLKSKIKINFHEYKHPIYNQLYGDFKEYACILDLILNEGSKSLSIIKSGNLNKFKVKGSPNLRFFFDFFPIIIYLVGLKPLPGLIIFKFLSLLLFLYHCLYKLIFIFFNNTILEIFYAFSRENHALFISQIIFFISSGSIEN